MKKLTFLIMALCLLGSANVDAQDIKSGFGIRLGANVSRFGGDINSPSALFGPHAGIYYSIGISENFALQPELIYSIQGSQFSAATGTSSISDRLDYINLPIMAKIYLTEGFNIQVGPYIGILAGFDSGDDTVQAEYRDFDFGVAAGLAYEFFSGFNLGARYNLGLADVNVESNGATASASASRTNQVFQFFLGYTF